MVNNKILKLTNTFQVLNIKGRNNNCGHLKSHLLLLMQVECFSVYNNTLFGKMKNTWLQK